MNVKKVLGLIFGIVLLSGFDAAPEIPGDQRLDIRPHEQPDLCVANAGQISVTINGVTEGGILTVELYNPSKRDFLRKASRVKRVRIPAMEGQQIVCFTPPAPGRYAIAAYDDQDADRDLDQKWNKLPDEPFGLSTNPKLRLGFPRFDEADFEVPAEGVAITINLVRV